MEFLKYLGALVLIVAIVLIALHLTGFFTISVYRLDEEKPSIYLYGPACCGKTRNAERLRKHFGLDVVIDDYCMMGYRQKVPSRGALVIGADPDGAPVGLKSISYAEAMERLK